MKKALVIILTLVVMAALMLPACAPAGPAEPFKIGMTAIMTGRMASGYLPLAEGFKVYIQQLNDAGGIDGRQVELYLEDDRGEGGLSVSNLRKFVERGANLLMAAAVSPQYEGLLAEAKAANIPLIILGIGHQAKMLPPTPDPMLFGGGMSYGAPSCSFAANVIAMYDLIEPPFDLGILTLDSPGNRFQFEEYTPKVQLPKLNIRMPIKQYLSPAAPDPKGFALKFKEANVDAVMYCGPAAPGLATWDALRKVGWQGVFALTIGEPIEFAAEKVKGDPKVVLQAPCTLLGWVDLPEHAEIKAAADKYGVVSANSYLTQGWVAGQGVAEILKRTGYPATTEKLLKVMNDFEFSLKPLAYGVEWSSTDHCGPLAYQAWHWDAAQGTFVAGNWILANAEGTEWKDLGPKL